MSLVKLVNISKKFGDSPVLDTVSIDVNRNDKIGIVGINGGGKTTLLRIMMGEEKPDKGIIERASNLRFSYVTQLQDFAPTTTLADLAYMMHPTLSRARITIDDCESYMATPDFKRGFRKDETVQRYGDALDIFEKDGGYTIESTLGATLSRIGLNNLEPGRLLNSLSPGELKAAQFAAALNGEPEILFLDEPTNHTDPQTSEFLDGIIVNHKGTVVYVTHDRYLLNKVNNRIVEVRNHSLTEFSGTYDQFVEYRFEHHEAEMTAYHNARKELAKMKQTINRLQSWANVGSDKAAKKAAQLGRQMKEMVVERPAALQADVRVDIGSDQRGGQMALYAKRLSVSYGNRDILDDVTFKINRGDRIGIVGANGSGKTTLLNCLLGYETPTLGSIELGPSTKIGYLSQQDINLNPQASIEDELLSVGIKDHGKMYGNLKLWQFTHRDLGRKVQRLSGGERKKLQLIKLIHENPNLIILDEPTDHLDMTSRESLEAALGNYQGSLVIVSHDRYLLDALTTSTLFLQNGKTTLLQGSYSENLATIRPKF